MLGHGLFRACSQRLESTFRSSISQQSTLFKYLVLLASLVLGTLAVSVIDTFME